jgi:hypothetical protein
MGKSFTRLKPLLLVPSLHFSGVVLAGFLGLAVLANAFAAFFVAQEHYIYYWDLSGYWIRWMDISVLLVQHPVVAFRSVVHSVWRDDYNYLPVLPLVPVEWLFGTSRLTYILAVTNLFVLPGAFLIAYLARRVCSTEPRSSSLIVAAASILMLHSLWVPVLQGLPDVAGVAVIGGILLLHFGTPLAEQRWAHLLGTGLLLCLLMVLRRWYAYWAVAFFPALAVAQSLDIYQRHGLVSQEYITTARNAIIIGLTFLISLFGLAAPFAWRAITTDYSDIYSAWRTSESLLDNVKFLPSYFGWLVFYGGLIGLVRLMLRRENPTIVVFLLVQSVIVFALFARVQDFDAHYSYLLFPALAFGFATVVIDIVTRITNAWWRAISVGILWTVLLAGSSTVFVPKAAPISELLGSLAPNARWYPLVRNDFDILDGLLDRLDELESRQPGDIYVLASSELLNSGILENYCRLGPRPRFFCDRILSTADVDKRDGFPRQFLRASYLVVAAPTQYHLAPDGQRVISVLAREVMEGHGIGRSFERFPGEFNLEQGVRTWVCAKVRPFQRTDLDALAAEFARYYPDKRAMFRTTD